MMPPLKNIVKIAMPISTLRPRNCFLDSTYA